MSTDPIPNSTHANTPSAEVRTAPIPANVPHWLTKGVWGIGFASFLADVGHEIPTALFASLVTITLGAPAAALGLIEGLADGLAGLARFTGGALADDPHRRRNVALGGYSLTAILSALSGIPKLSAFSNHRPRLLKPRLSSIIIYHQHLSQ